MTGTTSSPREYGGGAVDATLKDGTPVRLRPAGELDGPGILSGFEHCSAETRYYRFMSGGYRLTEHRLAELTGADQDHQVVWIALATTEDGPSVVALARFTRSAGTPDSAEVAFIVVDDFQGRGVGGLLLESLRVAARCIGIRTFVADVFTENLPMKSLLLRRGAHVAERHGSEATLTLAIGDDRWADVDDDQERAIRALAEAARSRRRSSDSGPTG